MVVVSITLPGNLLNEFDIFIRSKGYYSRSEAFRDALRSLMSESQLLEKESGRVAATIVVIYEYARKDIATRMIQLTCDCDDVVIENLNRQLGDHYCLSVFVAEGTVEKIRSLAGRIRGMHGALQVKTILIPMEGHLPTQGATPEP